MGCLNTNKEEDKQLWALQCLKSSFTFLLSKLGCTFWFPVTPLLLYWKAPTSQVVIFPLIQVPILTGMGRPMTCTFLGNQTDVKASPPCRGTASSCKAVSLL